MKRRKRTSSASRRSTVTDSPERTLSPAGDGTPPKTRRIWVFRAVALLLPLLLLGLLEAGLRMAGYGFSTGFFLRDRVGDTQVLTDNRKFGQWFFPASQARGVAPFSIPATKPPGTYRIFVLGESAAMGDPEPAFSFARMIEVMLRDRYPRTRFEIVNTGITAINSHTILPIARDCARHDGDLWLIYMGNNEVVGPYGAGTIFGAEAPPLPAIRATLAVKSTRVGQLLANLEQRWLSPDSQHASWRGMQMFLDHQVAVDDPRMKRVYSHFEKNLAAILESGVRAGAQQIVCSVGSNLKDCPPFASMHGPGFNDSKQSDWQAAYTNGIAAETSGRFAEAEGFYQTADKIDPDFSELQYRRGHCFWELARYDEARDCFTRSRDLDTLRFRADTMVNRIIEEQTRGRTNAGIHFLDIASVLATNSAHGISGEDMFYEHVHLTFQGNYAVARAAADQIAPLLPAGIARGQATPDWLSPAEIARRLCWNEWSAFQIMHEVYGRLQEPPFVNQLDHAERMKRVEQLLSQYSSTANSGETLKKAAAQYQQATEAAPDDAILHYKMATVLNRLGDVNGSAKQWEAVIQLLPHNPVPYENLGILLCQARRGAEGEQQFAKALAIDPESVGCLNGMGLSLVNQGQFAKAAQFYERGLALKPPYSAGLRINLAAALESLGKNGEAEKQYRAALREDPQNPTACVNLGALLLKQRRIPEAVSQLESAVQQHSNLANAHLGLGVALEQQTNFSKAITQFEETLRLDPGNAIARRHLDQVMVRTGGSSTP